jgi:hypothetical protein
MLRIDPAHPPLWRTASSLQFGVDAVAIAPDPAPWQLRLVSELEHGVPESAVVPLAVAAGATARAARAFLALLDPVLLRSAEPAPNAVLQAAGDVPAEQLDAVGQGLAAAGCVVETAHGFDPPGGVATDAAAVLVVVAHRVVPPGFAAALMRADRPHLPIVLTPGSADVGPLVTPGASACLACLAAERRDADPAWPTLAAQLVGRTADAVDASVLSEAGIVAGRILTASARHPAAGHDRSLTVRAGSLHRALRMHRPHEDCWCRSLAGTETADAHALPAPTTPRAYAQPA